jgi:quinol monooxygenase YgiN
MVLEVGIVEIVPGRNAEFEGAMGKALDIMRSASGIVGAEVRRSVETPNRYIVLITWNAIEDHTLRLEQTPRFDELQPLIEPFVQSQPLAEHYEEPFDRIGGGPLQMLSG